MFLQKDFISPLDLQEHGLSILAGVVVWMPCLGQLPVAAGYVLKRSFHFKRQYLQHTSSVDPLYGHLQPYGESTGKHQHPNSLLLPPFQNQTAYLQRIFFLLGVLSQQYFQHLPPGFFIVPTSGKKAKDSIWHQKHVSHHTSEPRQEPENVQQGCNTVGEVVQRGRGVVKNAVTKWSREGQPGKTESVKSRTC